MCSLALQSTLIVLQYCQHLLFFHCKHKLWILTHITLTDLWPQKMSLLGWCQLRSPSVFSFGCFLSHFPSTEFHNHNFPFLCSVSLPLVRAFTAIVIPEDGFTALRLQTQAIMICILTSDFCLILKSDTSYKFLFITSHIKFGTQQMGPCAQSSLWSRF